jgi:hypothetical protein
LDINNKEVYKSEVPKIIVSREERKKMLCDKITRILF